MLSIRVSGYSLLRSIWHDVHTSKSISRGQCCAKAHLCQQGQGGGPPNDKPTLPLRVDALILDAPVRGAMHASRHASLAHSF